MALWISDQKNTFIWDCPLNFKVLPHCQSKITNENNGNKTNNEINYAYPTTLTYEDNYIFDKIRNTRSGIYVLCLVIKNSLEQICCLLLSTMKTISTNANDKKWKPQQWCKCWRQKQQQQEHQQQQQQIYIYNLSKKNVVFCWCWFWCWCGFW